MKKQITLLSGVLLLAGSVVAQQKAIPASVRQQAPKKFTTEGRRANQVNNAASKAEGDIIFQDDFSNASEWTIGTSGQGTFVVGLPSHPDFNTTSPGFGSFGAGLGFTQYNPTTEANGYAGFNGIKYLLTPPVAVQNSWIASDTIDFSGVNLATITFYQWYMAFNYDNVFFEYSTDGGATWATSIQLNTTVTTNTFTVGNTSMDFDTEGSALGMIRFRWESNSTDTDYGSGYGWAIDDVKITEGYDNKVSLLFAHQTLGEDLIEYTKFPATQVTGDQVISFGAEVQNVGNDALDFALTVTSGSYNETGTSVNIGSLETDSLAILEADGYTIPATPGVHNFVFSIGANEDLNNTSDSTETMSFEVTPSIMAVDHYNGTAASVTGSFANWSGQSEDDFTAIGNVFKTYTDGVIGAVQVGIDDVADEADYDGRALYVTILRAGDAGWEVVTQSDEVYMSDDYYGTLSTIYLNDPVQVEADEIYAVLACSYVGADNTGGIPIMFAGMQIAGNTVGADDASFDGLISLASDDLTPNVVEAPVVRIDFVDYTGIDEIANATDVVVAPNPFSNETAVNFTLKADAEVSVVVTDLAGRTVLTVPAAQMAAGNQSVAIDGTAFTAGVYNYTLTVGGNSVTKRIVKK
jgi:hypothetical protein